ncbi:uncharacterized protein LOC119347912 [Triticum dicoccoides]|uniref:uncharacterized protein LOC119347912 n=1 Tax=Triticum dicoccoides TaxID=85692 RepID=UPI00188E77D4|nr:uncharacterized protein LOC119347912 [Triticum dicoccoides]
MRGATVWLQYLSKDVDGATREILDTIWLTPNIKTMYFDGWNGFGASAVLKSLAAVLPSERTVPGLCFDKIICIDCSEWKNRRGVQRAIAAELQLDCSVMAILDKQDEYDDFLGYDESLRHEIDTVSQMINRTVRDIRFMMIFLNGSDAEIDVRAMGIPLTNYCNNMMIWAFSRSCPPMHRDPSELAKNLRCTQVFLHCSIKEMTISQFRELLHQEAATIVARNPCMLDIAPTIVADCCLYELFLLYNFHTATNFDWVSHASNYWTCDAIIQGDQANDIGNALHLEINWKCDASLLDHVLKMFMKHSKSSFLPTNDDEEDDDDDDEDDDDDDLFQDGQLEPPFLELDTTFLVIRDGDVYQEGPYHWISVTSRNKEVHGMRTIPAATSSFFLAFETSDHPRALPNGFFDHCSKLGVLILCCCAFNFASPSFLKCHGLRFLGLDHCTDYKTIEVEHNTEWLFLYVLRVLDIRYTNWNEIFSPEKMDLMTNIRELNIEGVMGWQYITHLHHRLPDLQRLRIIKPICHWGISEDVDNYFIDKESMEILDLSGNCDMKILPPSLSKASGLRLLVLDGCDELESIGGLPPSLESVSFNGYGPASQWTQAVELPPKQLCPSSRTDNKDVRIYKISLAGCTLLENLFLCWLPNLVELDLSGTSIKILDFETMVVQIPRLKRLFLIGCKHLRAITFLRESVPDLELVCIDTREGIVCPRPSFNKTKSFQLQVHAVVVDARLACSFLDMSTKGTIYFSIHVTSLPIMSHGVVQFEATNKDKIYPSDQEGPQLTPAGQYNDVLGMVGTPPMQAFPQPPTTKSDRHVEIAEGSFYVETELEGDNALGQLIAGYAESLHVHDILVPAILPRHYGWSLRCCWMERCPNLDAGIFSESYVFSELETFWASHLLMARWIWSTRSVNSARFENLQHIHLRSCTRLQVVLAGWFTNLPSLETLHIIHCGDLSHVFICNRQDKDTYNSPFLKPDKVYEESFPKWTSIHLHDLPKLQQICDVKMEAPALKSIKIRGCWGLRRLPSVGARGQGENKPTVEIEKDVWDALEWDADHRPDHFEAPVHSRYYKEKLPRVSVLRCAIYAYAY